MDWRRAGGVTGRRLQKGRWSGGQFSWRCLQGVTAAAAGRGGGGTRGAQMVFSACTESTRESASSLPLLLVVSKNISVPAGVCCPLTTAGEEVTLQGGCWCEQSWKQSRPTSWLKTSPSCKQALPFALDANWKSTGFRMQIVWDKTLEG